MQSECAVHPLKMAIIAEIDKYVRDIDALGGAFSDAHGCGYDEALADVLKILDGSDEPHKCKFPPAGTLSHGKRPARDELIRTGASWGHQRETCAIAIVEAIDALTAAVKAR